MERMSLFVGVTFFCGVLLLIGWSLATRKNPKRRALFKKSLWLFALPIMLVPWSIMDIPFILLLVILFEEGLKVIGAYSENERWNRFWLVVLYGLWELTIDKPLRGLAISEELDAWANCQVLLLILAAILPVLMHGITAAIYAFPKKRYLWASYIFSSTIHFLYNEAADRLYRVIEAGDFFWSHASWCN